MVSVFVLDHVLEPLSGQLKDFNIGICCFSTKLSALKSMSNVCMVQSGRHNHQLIEM